MARFLPPWSLVLTTPGGTASFTLRAESEADLLAEMADQFNRVWPILSAEHQRAAEWSVVHVVVDGSAPSAVPLGP